MRFLCLNPLSTLIELRTHFQFVVGNVDHRVTVSGAQSACLITAAQLRPLQESPAGGDGVIKSNTSVFLPLSSFVFALSSLLLFHLHVFPICSLLTPALSLHFPPKSLPHMCLSTVGTCHALCGGDFWVCVWSPAAVCTPDSAQLLLHGGGGLEVPDYPSLPPPHHRLLPWPSDAAEWLHWRLLWPLATQWSRKVNNVTI